MSTLWKGVIGIALAAGFACGASLAIAGSSQDARKPVAASQQAMKNFQDSWNVSYMKTMKDFQDDWNISYLKATKDFQDKWNVSYIKDFQDNWNTSYMEAMKDFQDNWNNI